MPRSLQRGVVVTVLGVLGLVVAACDPGGAIPPSPVPTPTLSATPLAPAIPHVTKIGFVTNAGSIDDRSFSQAIWEGVQQAALVLGAETKHIEPKEPKDYDSGIDQLVAAGYSPVVLAGFNFGPAAVRAAAQYPSVDFIGVDQAIEPGSAEARLPNYAGLVFEEDKAGFLAGALAAQMTQTGQIGAVLGSDTFPSIWRFGEGYKAGAHYIQPGLRVNLRYHNDVELTRIFNDPAWGRATGLELLAAGNDVIFGAAGNTSTGALLACAEKRRAGKPVWAIGVDTDQYETLPEARPALLSSAMKLLTPSVANLIQAAAAGTFHGGNNVGEVGLAPLHEFASLVPPAAQAQLQRIEQGLKDGTISTHVPPSRPTAAPSPGATAPPAR